MNGRNIDELLEEIARIARAGRGFFVATYPAVVDAEIRTAFAYVSDVKARLLSDLQAWVPAMSATDGNSSRVAAVERAYVEAHAAFDGAMPDAVALALGFGEDQLLKRVGHAYAAARLPALRQLLKTHYAQLLICRQAMWRLNGRMAA
jgi:uncharacterized protein (TIGR02284 family)